MNHVIQQLIDAKEAARKMTLLTADKSRRILLKLADELVKKSDMILLANKMDVEKMEADDPRYDRLLLSLQRIEGIAADVRNVATLNSPVGRVLDAKTLANGLSLRKVSVPLGVVGVIYEARPNVTVDVFALALRSGNVMVLKGGSDAEESNKVITGIIKEVLLSEEMNPNVIQLLPAHREAAAILMNAIDYVDVLIPRGSQGLIDSVRKNSRVPVIETGAGIVHTYFDESADIEMGAKVVLNAKTRRPSVCNALDCLIVHRSRLNELKILLAPLIEKGVEVFADEEAYLNLDGHYPSQLLQRATTEDFGREFLSLRMSVKSVASLDEALEHVYKYSSRHSEAIISENRENIERFLNEVDAAAVYVNASTAFTDGAQFGLGAEIGISTQKLHARGPMALCELTSYKWQIEGNGQVRPA